MRTLVLVAALAGLLAVATPARAQQAKARVAEEIETLEAKLKNESWSLGRLEEKKQLQDRLGLLRKLFDRIIDQESEVNTLGCNGSTLDPSGGPPSSSAQSDTWATLAMGRAARNKGSSGVARAGGVLHELSDDEVMILAEIVAIEDRLEKRFHLDSNDEKQKLQARRGELLDALRTLRNSRC